MSVATNYKFAECFADSIEIGSCCGFPSVGNQLAQNLHYFEAFKHIPGAFQWTANERESPVIRGAITHTKPSTAVMGTVKITTRRNPYIPV